jgi:hypothetical protein
MNWHWMTVLGLLITILGALYGAYSLLDRKHVMLVIVMRSFLLGMMSALLAGCAGGVSLLLTYLAITLLSKFGLSGPELSYSFSLTDALSNILPGFLVGAAMGLIFGLPVGFMSININSIFKSSQKTRFPHSLPPLAFWAKKRQGSFTYLLFWKIVGMGIGLVWLPFLLRTSGLFSYAPPNISMSDSELVAWEFGLAFRVVVVSTFILFIGFFIGSLGGQPRKFINQPKLRITLLNKEGEKGVYNFEYKLHISWVRFWRGCGVGSVNGALAALVYCIVGLSSLYHFLLLSNSATFHIGFIDILLLSILDIFIGAAIGAGVLGSISGIGPPLAFWSTRLDEHTSARIGLVLGLIGIIISTIPSLLPT